MKRNLFYLLMLVCSMSVFTACGDDDDDVKFPIDEEIAGTYKGTLDVFVAGVNIAPNMPKNISMTNAGGNKINMGLKNLEILGMNLTVDIPNCEVKESAGGYAFTGSQTLAMPAPIGNCPILVDGTILDGKATINLDITVPEQQNLKVKVTYQGLKLTGSESAEAKILSFTFDSDVVTEQPVIDEATGKITFKINDAATKEELNLTPVFTISENATVSPASGVAQDFSDNKTVVYTVVAGNGTTKQYTVGVKGSQNLLKYSFEEWEPYGKTGAELPLPRAELASSSEGAALLAGYGKGVPMYKSEDKAEGTYAARLVTLDLSEFATAWVPAITSGTIFTGKFDIGAVVIDRLLCTKFGLPYDKKPLRFKGWYKYTPGAIFIDGSDFKNIVPVPGKIDECAIQAILYKVENDKDVLNGHNINTDDSRVAIAALEDGKAKAKYTHFDIPFTYLPGKSYEVGAKYKLAIVCSSSKEGDTFKGAGGSTLIVDELEVIGE